MVHIACNHDGMAISRVQFCTEAKPTELSDEPLGAIRNSATARRVSRDAREAQEFEEEIETRVAHTRQF